MTPSEDKAGIASADTSEKPRAPDEATAAEPSDAPEQASTDSSSTPDASARPPPEEAEKEPAGPPSEEDPAALKEQLLRVLAEQQNFRRRLERERDDAVRFAATQLVKDLLQTADNLSRALLSAPPSLPDQNEALQNLLAGVAASERALQDTFAKHRITRIEPALGEAFDPDRHQAMFEVEGSECEPGRIAQVVLPGYAYHERLLRPAFVGVAGRSPGRPAQGDLRSNPEG
jgi:molecular chaperone GrpE